MVVLPDVWLRRAEASAVVLRKYSIRDELTPLRDLRRAVADRHVIALARIVLRLLADLAGLVVLWLRPRRSVEAENLFLRRQLALYHERGVKARRVDAATRVSLALLSWLFDWRDVLVVVRPETLVRWRRAGWRLFWRVKSRPGRPPSTCRSDRRGAHAAISVGRLSYAITRARSSPVTSSWRSRRHSDCSTCSWSSSTAAADSCASP